MENDKVIGSLKLALIGKDAQSIEDPTWTDIEDALIHISKTSRGGYVSLRDVDDSMSMIVFGELNMFHIGIVTEDDESFVYCNGSTVVDSAEVPIAGNYFKEHQICRDFDILKEIVRYFYNTGKRLDNTKWEC